MNDYTTSSGKFRFLAAKIAFLAGNFEPAHKISLCGGKNTVLAGKFEHVHAIPSCKHPCLLQTLRKDSLTELSLELHNERETDESL